MSPNEHNDPADQPAAPQGPPMPGRHSAPPPTPGYPPRPGQAGQFQPGPPPSAHYPAQQYSQQYPPAQQYPAQQYPAQQHPGQQYPPAQPYPQQYYPPAQQYPAQQHPAQQHPAQQHPAQQHPAQQYPAQQYYPQQGQPPPRFPAQGLPAQGVPAQGVAPPLLRTGDPTAAATVAGDDESARHASRRAVLAGAGVAVVAGAAGFGWYALAGPKPRSSAPAAGYPSPGGTGSPGGTATPASLGTVADIPEGGGVVLADQEVVLTRESGDKVHCFSAVCTHQGCLVTQVGNGQISCPCHGSAFDATTGAVVIGPATTPLTAIPVTVVNGSIYPE